MIFAVCALLLGASVTSATARSIWIAPADSNEVRLNAMHPTFDRGDISMMSMLWTLSVINTVSPRNHFQFEVPFSHMKWEEQDGSTAIGNPYIGWLVQAKDSPWSGDIGIRLPLASNDEMSTFMGVVADQVDGAEAWIPDYVSAQALATFYKQDPRTPGVRFGFGPSLLVYMGDNDYADGFEMYLRYYAQVVFPSNDVLFGLGVSGRYLVTEESDGFDESSIHDLAIFAARGSGKWRPAGRVRIPWDEEMAEILDVAFELSLGRGF